MLFCLILIEKPIKLERYLLKLFNFLFLEVIRVLFLDILVSSVVKLPQLVVSKHILVNSKTLVPIELEVVKLSMVSSWIVLYIDFNFKGLAFRLSNRS